MLSLSANCMSSTWPLERGAAAEREGMSDISPLLIHLFIIISGNVAGFTDSPL